MLRVLLLLCWFLGTSSSSPFPEELGCRDELVVGGTYSGKEVVSSSQQIILMRDGKAVTGKYIPDEALSWRIPKEFIDTTDEFMVLIKGEAQFQLTQQSSAKCGDTRVDNIEYGFVSMPPSGEVTFRFAVETESNISVSDITVREDDEYYDFSGLPTSSPTTLPSLTAGEVAFVVIFLLLSICCCCVAPVAACVYVCSVWTGSSAVSPYDSPSPYGNSGHAQASPYPMNNSYMPHHTTASVIPSRPIPIPDSDVTSPSAARAHPGGIQAGAGPAYSYSPGQQNRYSPLEVGSPSGGLGSGLGSGSGLGEHSPLGPQVYTNVRVIKSSEIHI